jgi:CDP-glucose 4,6-dehydratase
LEDLEIMTPWSERKVFLTGHTGFKGAWLSLWLQQLGARVTGFALPPPSTPSLFEQAKVEVGMNSILGDVRDREHLESALRECRPEVVFHLAAQSLVRASYADPVGTYATNVMGTVNLLEAVRKVGGVRALVVVTSDKCYENREWVWGYREGDPMGGFDPYSSSKGCAELVTAAYRNSFFSLEEFERHGTAIASARAGNVIGGGDWAADRLVPDIMRALLANQNIRIRYPNAIRPWQHVLEPLGGYLLLAERLLFDGRAYAQPWNFGPSDEEAQPVSWIVKRILQRWGSGRWELAEGSHPHEATYLKLDCSKSRTVLQWRPKMPLEKGLDLLVDWYKICHKGGDVRAITMTQIAEYVGTAAKAAGKE